MEHSLVCLCRRSSLPYISVSFSFPSSERSQSIFTLFLSGFLSVSAAILNFACEGGSPNQTREKRDCALREHGKQQGRHQCAQRICKTGGCCGVGTSIALTAEQAGCGCDLSTPRTEAGMSGLQVILRATKGSLGSMRSSQNTKASKQEPLRVRKRLERLLGHRICIHLVAKDLEADWKLGKE